MDVAIDDATRLAYIEVLTDEKATTAVGFLKPPMACLNELNNLLGSFT